MSKKTEYIAAQQRFLEEYRANPDVRELPAGVLCKEIVSAAAALGEANPRSARHPNVRSVVSVHYTGRLTNGRIFDDTRREGIPAAFRLSDVIAGWQIALTRMQPGDRWEIVIPAAYAYGAQRVGDIPANSTLIFDVELLSIA